MLNLEKHMFDLTMEDELSTVNQELKYGIDYDYVIESFYCEYKLDVKELNAIQVQFKASNNPIEQQFLINEFHRLYPEFTSDNIGSAIIPETIMKKAYFVQSPKRKDGLPAIHYSLKEKMLSDFRATRSRVKKEMEHAAEIGDTVSEVRFNAKQLAIKVVCNSEYGASNNEFFAHYDPDVAAAVTYASRQLIKFLTNNLETSALYVDEKFLNDNKKQIEALKGIDCLNIEKYNDKDLFNKRRHVIRRIFDDAYNVICPQVYKINIKPSTVCYQDTDSNYYKNDYIADYYTRMDEVDCDDKSDVNSDGNDDGKEIDCKCDINSDGKGDVNVDSKGNDHSVNPNINSNGKDSNSKYIYVCSPETIDECMHMMLFHNELMANFARVTIQRRPYALGFEGAFIICRYLNRKKKYYGIKWGDDAELRLDYKLQPEAYTPDGVLIRDYSKYWKPKKTVIPQPNGEYIYLDVNKLLNEGVNYLDYAHSQNVKCTGVDLARRDQYKFINFFHMVVLQKDLRLMRYLGDDEWEVFRKDEPMKSIIDNVITTFQYIINSYSDIAHLRSDKQPEINFKLTDFSKNAAYRHGKLNAVSTIVRRLTAEGKTKYIPTIGERMSYVTILDEKTEQERLMGKASSGNIAARSYVIQELLDMLYEKYPVTEFNERMKETNLHKLTYEDYISAKAICMLDFKYYLECLCKSMALYIVGDLYPEIIKDIDDGVIDPKTAGQTISKLQAAIAKSYVKQYFYTGREVSKSINSASKALKSYVTQQSKKGMELLYQVYSDIRGKEFTKEDKNLIMDDAETNLKKYKSLSKKMDVVYKNLCTNYFFNKFNSDDPIIQKLYDKFIEAPEALLIEKLKCDQLIANYENIYKIVQNIKFEAR